VTLLPTPRLLAWGARHVGGALLVLLGASLLLFAVARAAPGEGVRPSSLVVAAEGSGPAGPPLPRSWTAEYGAWLAGVARGDFGRSAALQRGRPVAELLGAAFRRSLALAGAALALSAVLAAALAAAVALRPRSSVARLAALGVHGLSTVPVFLWAYVAVAGGNALLVRGARQGWWALPSWFPFPSSDAWVPWAAAVGILAVGDGLLADLYRRFRAELEHAARAEHMVGVRMLGLSVPLAVARGFLPGASSHLARRISFALGSLVVLESALGWPGLGYLAWRAAAERDLPVLLGVALVLAAVVRAAALCADAVWYGADPRGRGPA
jgi:peptide/nickel transport system permease protein